MGKLKNIIDDLSKYYKDIEVFSKKGRSRAIFFSRGTGFENSQSEEKGVAIRLWKHNGSGYFLHSSDDDPNELKQALNERLKDSSYSKGSYPPYDLAKRRITIPDLNICCYETADTSLEQLRNFFFESIKYLEERWKGVIRVNSGELRTGLSSNYLGNNRGFEGSYEKSMAYMTINFQITSKSQGKKRELLKRTHNFHITSANFTKFKVDPSIALKNFEQIMNGNIKFFTLKLKNKEKSNIKVVFSAEASSLLLRYFLEFLQEAHSFTTIFSEKLTVVDNAKLEGGLGSLPFDGAGFPPKKTAIIQNGRLIHWLENIIRPSYRDYPGLGPTNLYIQSGEKSQEEMINHVARGVFIVSLKAFKNPYNKEKVSFLGQGFLIEGGKLSSKAGKFIITTEVKDIFKNILEIGHDLQFLPWSGAFGAPSLLIEKVCLITFS